MAAAQTKEHEEDKHTGMQEKKMRKKRKRKSRKQGIKAQRQARKKIVLNASPYVPTNLPVSATKPRGC